MLLDLSRFSVYFCEQLPVQSVEIRDGDALEKGDDEQRDVAAEIVE